MNWKLILQLSMFGLAMGLATVFAIPSNIEPVFWLVIFLVCAWIIARRCPTQRFKHGLFLGICNSIWITAAHVGLYSQYIANHAAEAGMMTAMPISPRVMMAATGPIGGFVFGTIIGLLALLAGKLFVKPATPVSVS